MKILKNAGYSKILAVQPGFQKPQHLMEQCGHICYQANKGKITDESASKFVRMLVKRTHYSVIEHGWIGFIIPKCGINFYKYFWPYTKFLFITERENGSILISGNMETWRKIYKHGLLDDSNLGVHLNHYCPDIFLLPKKGIGFLGHPITAIEQLKSKEEFLNHICVTVLCNNISRGFTHEMVRHRVPVYSQESTRYVDYAGLKAKNPNLDKFQLKCIVPPHRDENQKVMLENGQWASMTDGFIFIEMLYRALRKAGWPAEDSRQVLPIGLKSQIAISGPLGEWHYVDYRRIGKPAHWEIRRVMGNSFKQRKKLFPPVFADFKKAGVDVNGLAYFKQIVES